MDKNMRSLEQRAIHYWYTDGLAEISTGLICILLAAFFLALHFIPISGGLEITIFLSLFALGYVIRWILKRVKERQTYPRTGYLEYKQVWTNKVALLVVTAFSLMLLAAVSFLNLNQVQVIDWTAALCGLIFAFIFGWTGYQTAAARFTLLAVFCLAAGLLLSLTGFGDLPGAAVLSASTGLLSLIFGIITRWRYLHQNLLPGEEPHAG